MEHISSTSSTPLYWILSTILCHRFFAVFSPMNSSTGGGNSSTNDDLRHLRAERHSALLNAPELLPTIPPPSCAKFHHGDTCKSRPAYSLKCLPFFQLYPSIRISRFSCLALRGVNPMSLHHLEYDM